MYPHVLEFGLLADGLPAAFRLARRLPGTGERVAALERTGEMDRSMRGQGTETTLAVNREADRRAGPGAAKERDRAATLSKDREDLTVDRSRGVGIEFGL